MVLLAAAGRPLLATVEALGVSPDLRGVPDSGPAWWGAWEVLR
jgi:hypothetical protein